MQERPDERRIRHLFGLVVLLFAVLIGFTSYWSVFDAEGAGGEPRQQAAAARAAADPARADLRRATGPCSPATGSPAAAPTRFYSAPLSDGRAVRARRGLQLRGRAAGGLERSYNDDLTGDERRVHDDPRRAARQGARGRRPGHDARPRRPAGRRSTALGGPRRRRWSRSSRSTGRVLVMATRARLQPEPRAATSSRSLNRDAAARRCSTARRRAAIRRARPSRS